VSAPESPPATFGRLSAAPHSLLLDLLYRPGLERDLEEVLPWLLRVDAAHVVMLARREVLPSGTAAALLRVNRELSARLAAGERPFPVPDAHRGLYMLYERQYTERLGTETSGAAHVARSRNDINAAITRLRLREELLALADTAAALVRAALGQAEAHTGTVISGFSHFQPAQPATLAHYLAGVAGEIASAAEALAAAYDTANRSPLGAGAGFGTCFSIDPELTARLLGFDGTVGNSLEAVASRLYAVQALSGAAMLGTALNRASLDLQLWTTHAYGFLTLPDDLVSTSSMMPQKRNAFVFESIRGRTSNVTSGLMGLLYGLKNTPFSNSVEVSADASAHLWPALAAARTAGSLMALLISGLEVKPARMRSFLEGAETGMTALADHLVGSLGLSFRAAHECVAELLSASPDASRLPPTALRAALEEAAGRVLERPVALDEAALAEVLDPEAIVRAAAFGGGPAPQAVEAQLAALRDRWERLASESASRRARLDEAGKALEREIEALL
jgi:argininosuccinate lyase